MADSNTCNAQQEELPEVVEDFVVTARADPEMNCGGPGPVQPADAEIQAKIDQYRDNVEAQHGPLEEYTAVSYRGQLVNGNNFYVKVRVAPEKHLEVVFWEPFQLSHGPEKPGTFTRATVL
ncbi:hypothetical protein BV898_02653 [Hypsibius exemplaris]|uniref:Cystatin domain-containing protein n=1 Tax=Hypsibius exemplaris TaxID=2072580 RepID=A0A1W0X7K6_HYPEX|nr:hypothetical protein BV898_02653 [Hypsibius exemplaris]